MVCGGNTCRSPMAKAIMEHRLMEEGASDTFEVDSAAYDAPTYQHASGHAREAVKKLLGTDLLASHAAKKLSPALAVDANLILVMAARMKRGLPPDKTFTLREYAGGSGDIADPFEGSLDTYLKCAREIAATIDDTLPKLL